MNDMWGKPEPEPIKNKKIRIAPNQPINTSVFEEAIVLEYNGALTPDGLKEYRSPFIKEGDYKPIIDFINRL